MAFERMRSLLAILTLLVSAFAAGGADARKTSGKQLDKVLYEYSSSLRWSEFETAWSYVEPDYRDANPLSELELARYAQFQVSGYEVKRREYPAKDEYRQVVEIRLVNRHTQVEKIVTERERWRWDAQAKRWWLATGLPSLARD